MLRPTLGIVRRTFRLPRAGSAAEALVVFSCDILRGLEIEIAMQVVFCDFEQVVSCKEYDGECRRRIVCRHPRFERKETAIFVGYEDFTLGFSLFQRLDPSENPRFGEVFSECVNQINREPCVISTPPLPCDR